RMPIPINSASASSFRLRRDTPRAASWRLYLALAVALVAAVMAAGDLHGQQTCPCSVWTPSTTPGPLVNDAGAVELGMKFQSDTAGYITGVRFYKYAQNTGAHVGSLWSAAGANLATITFSGESASGWKQAVFSTPVAVTA